MLMHLVPHSSPLSITLSAGAGLSAGPVAWVSGAVGSSGSYLPAGGEADP